MLTLTAFLALLPGIKPLKTRQLLLEGSLLTKEQKRDLRDRNRSIIDIVVEVGPDAAEAILAAYTAGKLPMRTSGLKPTATPQAEAYLAEAPKHRQQIAERERLQQAMADPSLLNEADLQNFRLLDSLFFSLNGSGGGTLTLAGVQVTKSIAGYLSNSGKSRGWRVTFSWVGSDGRTHTIEKVPPEASNRRNDAERGWGLHE